MAPKRKSSAVQPVADDVCAVCLDPYAPGDALFVGPCKHVFHVQCAERNFVVGRATTCPCCRAPFKHAPGFVALARAEAEASRMRPAPSLPLRVAEVAVMDDLPIPASSAETPFHLPADFAKATVVLDTPSIPAPTTPAAAGGSGGGLPPLTALVTLQCLDDDDATPIELPTDFVLCIDVSGSMSGPKLAAAKDALLKMSDMFGPRDRVALIAFNHAAVQLTALSPLSLPESEAAFRRAAMECQATGGTSIVAALSLAQRILFCRRTPNQAAHVLLLSDGQDRNARTLSLAGGVTLSTLGFGADHDADLLSSLAQPAGSFTYVERTDLLDEMLAAYVGDATRVLTNDFRVLIRPAPGTVIRDVKCPGTVTRRDDGTVEAALGAARVNDSRELLLTLDVSLPATPAAFEMLSICAHAPTEGVTTAPLVVSFSPRAAPPAPADMDRMDAFHNRSRLEVASAAVADVLKAAPRTKGAGARAAAHVVEAARTQLRGSDAARAGAMAELEALKTSAADEDARQAQLRATEARYRTTQQRMSHGKGGASKRYTMIARKGVY